MAVFNAHQTRVSSTHIFGQSKVGVHVRGISSIERAIVQGVIDVVTFTFSSVCTKRRCVYFALALEKETLYSDHVRLIVHKSAYRHRYTRMR